jgi:PAS domain S-box-containing protein
MKSPGPAKKAPAAPSPETNVSAEDLLRQSEERYRHLIEVVTDYIFTVRIEAGKVVETRHGPGCEAVTGYTVQEMNADPDLWLRMVIEEDRPVVIRQAQHLLAGEEVRAIEHRITTKSGEVRWVRNTPVPQYDAKGHLVAFDGLIQDITDRVTAEQALRKSEAQLHAIIQAAPIPKFVIDMDHRVISWNKALVAVTGISARDVLGTRKHWKAFYRVERPCLADLLVDRIPEKIVELYPGKFKKSEISEGAYEVTDFFPNLGTSGKWLHFMAAPITDTEGNIIGAIETLEDISDLFMTQAALKESEDRYSSLFTNSNSISLLIDPDTGLIVDANTAAVRYYGYPRDQLISLGIYDLNRLEKKMVIKNLQRAKDEKEKHLFSTHYLADGSKRYVEVFSGPIRVNGKPLFYSIIHDITDRKMAEQALRESEERYRTLIDRLPDYVIVHRDGILLYVNPVAGDRLGYKTESLIGKSMLQFVAPEFHPMLYQALKRRMSGEEIPAYELKIIAHDGTLRTVLVNGAYISYQGAPASLNVLSDITAIKEAEEAIRRANEDLEKRVVERTNDLSRANIQLVAEIDARAKAEGAIKRSLEEKDLLLREIHHRVKNNLQIISSLLNLQSRSIHDENVLESLRESQSRVRAMALVHERIYRSHNISDIDLKEYLTYLTRQIFSFYNIQHSRIRSTITMDDIPADIDTVIPVGLIMNELVSNSLKHAFTDGRNGIISIEGIQQEPDMLRFIYHDDGVGFPPGFDWKNTESLGLRLVNNLVDQLNGTIDLGVGEGTTFIITIRPKREKSSGEKSETPGIYSSPAGKNQESRI